MKFVDDITPVSARCYDVFCVGFKEIEDVEIEIEEEEESVVASKNTEGIRRMINY